MSGRMISRRSVLALAACTALGAVGCSKTEEYTGPELILRYAENQPEDYPTTQAALAFADLVAERTEGRVKVVVYSGGELGAEQSVIEQMQYGGIDFARVSLSQLAEYQPALSVLQLPFLYTDAPQMWRTVRSAMNSSPASARWTSWACRGSMPVSAASTPAKRWRRWRTSRG